MLKLTYVFAAFVVFHPFLAMADMRSELLQLKDTCERGEKKACSMLLGAIRNAEVGSQLAMPKNKDERELIKAVIQFADEQRLDAAQSAKTCIKKVR